MPVRPAIPDDLADVLGLIVASARRLDRVPPSLDALDHNDWRAYLFGDIPALHALLATDDSTPIGHALWYPTFSTTLGRQGIWVDDLFVMEPFRRHGHARALMTELRRMTSGRIEWVAEEHSVAARLYRSLGAKPVTRGTRFRWDPSS